MGWDTGRSWARIGGTNKVEGKKVVAGKGKPQNVCRQRKGREEGRKGTAIRWGGVGR